MRSLHPQRLTRVCSSDDSVVPTFPASAGFAERASAGYAFLPNQSSLGSRSARNTGRDSDYPCGGERSTNPTPRLLFGRQQHRPLALVGRVSGLLTRPTPIRIGFTQRAQICCSAMRRLL